MATSSKTVIHFIRHGEVENPHHLRYGRLPGFHLSAKGRHQIEQTAHHLARLSVKSIYTSPLERAQQTATILAMAHPSATLRVDARLLENETSDEFEGKSRELAFRYPTEPNPKSETTQEIIDRMLAYCHDMVRLHSGEHVIAVSHGDPIGLLYHWLLFGLQDAPDRHLYPAFGSDWQFVWVNGNCQTVVTHMINEAGRIRQ